MYVSASIHQARGRLVPAVLRTRGFFASRPKLVLGITVQSQSLLEDAGCLVMSTQIASAARVVTVPRSEAAIDSEPTLKERVWAALQATGYRVFEHIQITAHEGLVRLRGDVARFYEKQVATAAVMTVPGVVDLQNDIHVEAAGQGSGNAIDPAPALIPFAGSTHFAGRESFLNDDRHLSNSDTD